MARGDTLPPARRGHFDDNEDSSALVPTAKRMSYSCWADGCPMPGAITLGADSAVCAWHYGQGGDQIPKVTRAIRDWECVQSEINIGRRILTSAATLASPKAHDDALRDAWARMSPAVLGSGWKPRLEPRDLEKYGEWVRRLERFLSNRIKEALNPSLVISDDGQPTPTVADMRSRLREARA